VLVDIVTVESAARVRVRLVNEPHTEFAVKRENLSVPP
jgi:hypothetical protein